MNALSIYYLKNARIFKKFDSLQIVENKEKCKISVLSCFHWRGVIFVSCSVSYWLVLVNF
jgi:hypothetical protein